MSYGCYRASQTYAMHSVAILKSCNDIRCFTFYLYYVLHSSVLSTLTLFTNFVKRRKKERNNYDKLRTCSIYALRKINLIDDNNGFISPSILQSCHTKATLVLCLCCKGFVAQDADMEKALLSCHNQRFISAMKIIC